MTDVFSGSLRRRAFLAGASAVAAAAALRPPAGAADLESINVGTIPGDMAAVVAYGTELGYYKAAGIDVHNTVLNSGPAVAAALVGGALDAGIVNAGTLASARSRGVPLRFFAPCAMQTPGSNVALVKKDASIASAADLANKTIGIVAINTVQHATTRAWLDAAGVDSKTVKFIEVPYPQMQAALDAGRVDVILPAEPFLSSSRAVGRSIGDVDQVVKTRYIVFGFAATDAWLASHGALAKAFADAVRKSAVWGNTHRAESAQMLVKTFNMSPATVNAMVRTEYGTTIDVPMVQSAIDMMMRYGFLASAPNPNDLIWKPAS